MRLGSSPGRRASAVSPGPVPRVMLFACAGIVVALAAAFAAEPHVEKIEFFGDQKVLIHFNTEPNRAYVLQYTTSLIPTNGGATSTWSNLFSSPAEPFINHFIIVDWRTNAFRFYRLIVTP